MFFRNVTRFRAILIQVDHPIYRTIVVCVCMLKTLIALTGQYKFFKDIVVKIHIKDPKWRTNIGYKCVRNAQNWQYYTGEHNTPWTHVYKYNYTWYFMHKFILFLSVLVKEIYLCTLLTQRYSWNTIEVINQSINQSINHGHFPLPYH